MSSQIKKKSVSKLPEIARKCANLLALSAHSLQASMQSFNVTTEPELYFSAIIQPKPAVLGLRSPNQFSRAGEACHIIYLLISEQREPRVAQHFGIRLYSDIRQALKSQFEFRKSSGLN